MPPDSSPRRFFVATVGTSILFKRIPEAEPIKEAARSYERTTALSPDLTQYVRDYYRRFLDENTRQLPAELVTFGPANAVATKEHFVPVRDGDHVMLLCSDTRDGEFCGRLLAAVFESAPGVTIQVLVMKEMSVSLDTQFDRAASAALSSALAEAYQRSKETNARLSFHLNGGYKAVLPLLTLLIGHLPHGPVESEAFLAHEDGTKLIRIPVMQAGVPDDLRRDLASIKASGSPVGNPVWAGYAYEQDDDGRYRVTFLGQIIDDLAELG